MNERNDLQDVLRWKRGAIEYPLKIDRESYHYLYTKPFRPSGHDNEFVRYFHDFDNFVKILNLPKNSNILDVGCGSGWVSEYFGRLGYDVVGIDISPEMIEIAKKRLKAASILPDMTVKVRFFVQDAEEDWSIDEKFDAIVFYDSLHHFIDAQVVLSNMYRLLKDDGKLLIKEGVKPPTGSEGEKELMEVMEKYDTIEKPYEPQYLINLLKDIGFKRINTYISIDGFFNQNLIEKVLHEPISIRVSNIPAENTIIAYKKEYITSKNPNVLKASIKVLEFPKEVTNGSLFKIKIKVKNIGDTIWIADPDPAGGHVTFRAKLLDKKGNLLDDSYGGTTIPRDLKPGEDCILTLNLVAPTKRGEHLLKLDMVDELITWFEDKGSKTVLLKLKVL